MAVVFNAQDGKIVAINIFTKAEAEERLLEMQTMQTNTTNRLVGLSDGEQKTRLEGRIIKLDRRIANIQTEIAKI